MTIRFNRVSAALVAALLSSSAMAQTAQEINAKPTIKDKLDGAMQTVTGSPFIKADTDMNHVIDAMASLHPKSIEGNISAPEARQQPSGADGAMKVLREQGKSSLPDMSVTTKNIIVTGGSGPIAATAYTPANASGALPVIVYYHGGGFVIANNSTYDASARGLAKSVNAVVIAVEYGKAPEHKFPASHNDAVAAYKWVTKNAASIGGDPKKIAIAGESAGGNLAMNVAIAARDQKLTMPVHELIVYLSHIRTAASWSSNLP